jgi:hypothetical protein
VLNSIVFLFFLFPFLFLFPLYQGAPINEKSIRKKEKGTKIDVIQTNVNLKRLEFQANTYFRKHFKNISNLLFLLTSTMTVVFNFRKIQKVYLF